MKYLFWLLIIAVVWYYWQAKSARQTIGDVRTPVQRPEEKMLACSHCGVHFPEAEGCQRDGLYFCCEAHSQAAEKGGN